MALTENVQSISPYATAARRAKPRAKVTILIAEDNGDSREMMITLLRLKGYNVIGVEDGAAAVNIALKTSPDLILLDLQLPYLDGFAVAKNLRSHTRFVNVPIVMLSGHDPATFRPRALAAGCTEYLLKPVDFARLDKVLSDFS